jgi:hypothetical protein
MNDINNPYLTFYDHNEDRWRLQHRNAKPNARHGMRWGAERGMRVASASTVPGAEYNMLFTRILDRRERNMDEAIYGATYSDWQSWPAWKEPDLEPGDDVPVVDDRYSDLSWASSMDDSDGNTVSIHDARVIEKYPELKKREAKARERFLDRKYNPLIDAIMAPPPKTGVPDQLVGSDLLNAGPLQWWINTVPDGEHGTKYEWNMESDWKTVLDAPPPVIVDPWTNIHNIKATRRGFPLDVNVARAMLNNEYMFFKKRRNHYPVYKQREKNAAAAYAANPTMKRRRDAYFPEYSTETTSGHILRFLDRADPDEPSAEPPEKRTMYSLDRMFNGGTEETNRRMSELPTEITFM